MTTTPKTPEKMQKEDNNTANIVTPEKTPISKGGIGDPHDNDVLCGRGGSINCHPGNERYRDLVEKRKRVYLTARFKREKRLIAGGIVNEIYSLDPPGRFLSRNKEDGLWYDIGDEKARDKTSQALRENAPTIRAEIETEIHKQREEMRRAEEEEEAARSSWSSHYGYPYQQSWDYNNCYDYGYGPQDHHHPPPPSHSSHHRPQQPPPPHHYHGPSYHGPHHHGPPPPPPVHRNLPPPPPHDPRGHYGSQWGESHSPRSYPQRNSHGHSSGSIDPNDDTKQPSSSGTSWSLQSTYSAFTRNLSFSGPTSQNSTSYGGKPNHIPSSAAPDDAYSRGQSMDEERSTRDGQQYGHANHEYRREQQYDPNYRPSQQHEPAHEQYSRRPDQPVGREGFGQKRESSTTSTSDIQPANANITNESYETSILNQFAEGFLSNWDTGMCVPDLFGANNQTDDRALLDSKEAMDRNDIIEPSTKPVRSSQEANRFCRIPSVDEDEGHKDEIEVVEMMDYEHPSEIVEDKRPADGPTDEKQSDARTPPPEREMKKVEIYWSNNVPDTVSSIPSFTSPRPSRINNRQISTDTCTSIGGASLHKVFDHDASTNVQPAPPSADQEVDGIGNLASPDWSHRGLKLMQSWEKSFRDNDDGSTISRDETGERNFVKSPKAPGITANQSWDDSAMMCE